MSSKFDDRPPFDFGADCRAAAARIVLNVCPKANIRIKSVKAAFERIIKSTLKRFDLAIMKYSNLQRLLEKQARDANGDIELLLALPNRQASQLMENLPKSKSQFRQDLFVLSESEFKRYGFFVEFGATNGIEFSNTYLLEKEFGWNGILAEPAKRWHKDLRNNRNCHIEIDCVWRQSNSMVAFNETDDATLSTIVWHSSRDLHREKRKTGIIYEVKTISLLDMLSKYDAPNQIDFLSIDTEGGEYEILQTHDFDKYRFKIIICEHNFTTTRAKIFELLTQKGYIRKFEQASKFDDWYVKVE